MPTTTPQSWREQFAKDYTTKVFEWASLEENTRNSLAYFTAFIETQIAQAYEKWYNKWWLEAKEDAVMWEI